MSQAALSRIPFPLKLALIAVLGLIAFKLIAQAGGLITLLVVVLWAVVILALLVDHGVLSGLTKVPALGHLLRFITNAKGRLSQAGDATTRRSLTPAERETLYTDAIQALHAMVGIDAALEAVHANVIDMAEADPRSAEPDGRGFATQMPGVVLLLVGPPGVGKGTVARQIARLYAGLGVTDTASVTTVTGRDVSRAGPGADLEAFAEERAATARGGLLLLEDADWLVGEPEMGGEKPGVAFGLGLVVYLTAHPRSLAIAVTLEPKTERLLRNDADQARWLSKLAVRTVPFDHLDEAALLELVERQLENEGFSVDPEAERGVSGLLREELSRFGSDHVDNANAALRAASRLTEAARRRGEAASGGERRVLTRADVRSALDEI